MNRRVVALALTLAVAIFGACSAQADQPVYLYGSLSGAYTPGHAIPVQLDTNAPDNAPVQVLVYQLPIARKIGLSDSFQRGIGPDFTDLLRVASFQATAPKANSSIRVGAIPALPIGYYALSATVRGSQDVVKTSFDVTTLGVVTNSVRNVRSLYAVDLRTFNAYPGRTQGEVYDGSAVRRLAFDRDGLATDAVPLGKSGSAYAVVSADDGSKMLVRFDPDSQYDDLGFVQTDRPIYRPGQTIFVRAIIRTGTIGSYAVPSGMRRISVTAPDGTIVYDHKVTLSNFGTVHASVQLAQDAPTGSYDIQVGDLSGFITVAAYKKPEYALTFTADQKYVIGGDRASFTLAARYFFGRAAAGFHLHYVAMRGASWFPLFSPYGDLGRIGGPYVRPPSVKVAEGDFVTDASGANAVAIGTDRTDSEQTITVRVDGRDASGRTISTSASVRLVPASFYIRLTPADWFAQQNAATTVAVDTMGYDEHHRANVALTVTITGSRWDPSQNKSVEFSHEIRSITTDGAGKASLSWTPAAAGSYTFVAKSRDERGYPVQGSTYLWAIGSDERSYFAPIEQPMIVAQKQSFRGGERPRILITLPKPNRDALLLVTTDRLISTRVVHVTGQTIAVDLQEPADASAFIVTVELPNENGVSTAIARIAIDPAPKTLRVSIAASQKRYAPGDVARFAVRALDARGKPVRAEFGIGVVDEAIYAVQAADGSTPSNAFYDNVLAYMYPDYSWFAPNQLVRFGLTNDMYAAGAQGPMALKSIAVLHSTPPVIRSNFQDTAFWSPSVVTDANGKATISFKWPDNLTTWRAMAVGVTRATDVGQASGDALVTKDFLVRLETPRFLRAGDHSQIIGIAQGLAAHPNVWLKLESTPALFPAALRADLTLDANQSANVSWPVVGPGVGNVLLTLSGSDGTLDDAMQSTLPLEAGTAAEHVRGAGALPDAASLTVAVPAGYVAGDVHLTLAPSIVAELVQNVRLLQIYPYYCTEQTVSTSLPAIFIDRILKQGGLQQPDDVNTSQIVNDAIARLGQLQHDDGSWGWWEYDNAHPFMTAYAMYALAEFRASGYNVSSNVFDRGAQSLADQLAATNGDTLRFWGGGQPGSEWNTRAFMLYALAQAAPAKIDPNILAQTKAHVGNLNPYAIAVLGLAEHLLGDDATARDLAAELDKRATDEGAYTFWRGDTWHYAWEDDPIETTAYALRLEVAVNPTSPRIARAVAFLRVQRQGNWWFTTKDTAAAIYALSEAYKPDASEFHPNETVNVLVDGKVVRTLHVTTPTIDAADASVVVPASAIHDGSTISFRRQGSGALYWSSDAVRYLPASATTASDAPKSLLERLFGVPPDLQIERSYDVGHDGPWRIGDKVHVTLTIRAHSDVQYLVVEDPFPAAAEPQPDQGRAADAAWSGLQLLDDRAVFFADRLYDGQPLTITYDLRVTTAGTYTAPPPTAAAMYGPPVSVIGRPTNVVVTP
jgi:uncharacterized protein YfaS (alpha-2-macroglobulin family)